jgi:TolB protein
VRIVAILAVLVVGAGMFVFAPSASADKIIFTHLTKSAGGLVVMRPDGSVVSVARGYVNNDYDLSVDGRRLVVIDDVLLVTPFTARDRLAVQRTRVLSRKQPDTLPQWSPDGRFVAGVRWGGSLVVLRLSSGRLRRLTTPVSMTSPSWSPDGRRIVAQGPRGLWIINVATGAAREFLSFDMDSVGSPKWAPDGRWIAFTRHAPTTGSDPPPLGSSQLWLVRPDGSGLRQLTHLTGADASESAWSPDGRRLAFITKAEGRFNYAVATIRANGSGLRTLYTRSGFNYGIDWSR